MWRVTILVRRKTGLATEAFDSQWIGVLAPAIADAAAADKRTHRVVVDLAPATLDNAVRDVFPALYDGLLELWFDSAEDAVDVMRGVSQNNELRHRAETVVDGSQGVAWLAKVVPSKAEQGTVIKFLAAGDVAEGVTLEEAHAYWAETHPVVAQTAPSVWGPLTRYTQFHGKKVPELDMGSWLAVARFVPMCSDMGFARQKDFLAVYTSDEYRDIVRPDEEKFSRPGDMLAFVSGEERLLAGRSPDPHSGND